MCILITNTIILCDEMNKPFDFISYNKLLN